MVIDPKVHSSFFCLMVLALFSCSGVRQMSTTTEQRIEKESSLFEVDHLNNIYIVSTQNELTKWSAKGELLYQFSDNRLGNIGILDVSNPLQTLVYYPDFRWLRFFDRTLNLTHELSLLESGFQNVNALSSSNDNNIWFFDEIDQIILKIDQEGKILIKSDDLRQVLKKSIFPNLLLERKNKLLLYDQENIYLFDAFGTFLNEIEIGQAKSLVFNGTSAYFLDEKNNLSRADMSSKNPKIDIVKQVNPSTLSYRTGLGYQFFRAKDHILIKTVIE